MVVHGQVLERPSSQWSVKLELHSRYTEYLSLDAGQSLHSILLMINNMIIHKHCATQLLEEFGRVRRGNHRLNRRSKSRRVLRVISRWTQNQAKEKAILTSTSQRYAYRTPILTSTIPRSSKLGHLEDRMYGTSLSGTQLPVG